jgi:hypothetical protein
MNKYLRKIILLMVCIFPIMDNILFAQSSDAEKPVIQQLSFPVARFQTGDNLLWKEKDFDDSNWAEIKTNLPWERQGYNGYDGYAWYRIRFSLPSSLLESSFRKISK